MRVLIVDDNRLLVEGLTNLLTAHGFEVVGTAPDGAAAVAQTQRHHPELVLMDIRMPRCDGLTATRLIKARMPETRIVMLTTSAEDDDLFEAVRSGACGYLLKNVSGDELIASLAALGDGVPPLSPGLARRVLEEFARRAVAAGRVAPTSGVDAADRPDDRAAPAPAPAGADDGMRRELTEREIEVLGLVAAGRTYKEVAAELGMSERTVRYHMAEIMDRLHLEHRSQVLAWAGQAGLLGHGRPGATTR